MVEEQSHGERPLSSSSKKRRFAETAVRLVQVTKRFGARMAVDDISLEIPRGRIYGLIGPNGAGKTTTFSLLAGYLEPTRGEVEVLGFSPRNVDSLRGRVGVLPQDALLPPLDTAGDFLVHMARLQGMGAAKSREAARNTLQAVGGADFWNLRCRTLSHGMAKRVALAQALLGEPDLVLLDEPTAGLDPRVAFDVRQLVKSLKGRCTVIISSHNLHELEEICDGAAVLDHGKVVAVGTISDLTATSEEVHIHVGRGIRQPEGGRSQAPVPTEALRSIPGVTRVSYEEKSRDLGILFDRSASDAEGVIGQALWILLNGQVRISGVTKGRGLEARVMDLTDE